MRVLQVQAFHHLSISARSVVLVSSYSTIQHQTDQLLLPNADLATKKNEVTLGRAHLEQLLHFNLTLSTLCFAQTLTHFGSVIVILSPIRATEETTKLKARLEQGKEETENLVCKLNNNVFTFKFLHICSICFVFLCFQPVYFSIDFLQKEKIEVHQSRFV